MGHKRQEGEPMRHEHNHKEQIMRDWGAQLPIFAEIKELGAEKYFGDVANLDKAFVLHDHIVRCMDERTPGGIHCAGSGTLLSRANAIDFFRRSGAEGISSHEGCGAVAIFAKKIGFTGDLEELAQRLAQEFAEEANLPYIGHLPVEKKYHFARAAYYDGTGIFDCSKVADLPPGFFINRANLEAGYAANTEAATAARIAMGDHGYGGLITEQEPFYFFVIGSGDLNKEQLTAELEPLKQEFGDKIVIAGFNAPEK